MGKLNPTQVRSLAEPGRYMDGDGLMLEIRPGGSKTWLVRLQANGRRRDYGLGSFKDISLSEAREKARDYTARAQHIERPTGHGDARTSPVQWAGGGAVYKKP